MLTYDGTKLVTITLEGSATGPRGSLPESQVQRATLAFFRSMTET
jgi:hypothetical protein